MIPSERRLKTQEPALRGSLIAEMADLCAVRLHAGGIMRGTKPAVTVATASTLSHMSPLSAEQRAAHAAKLLSFAQKIVFCDTDVFSKAVYAHETVRAAVYHFLVQRGIEVIYLASALDAAELRSSGACLRPYLSGVHFSFSSRPRRTFVACGSITGYETTSVNTPSSLPLSVS